MAPRALASTAVTHPAPPSPQRKLGSRALRASNFKAKNFRPFEPVGARLRAMLLFWSSVHQAFRARAFVCLRQPSYFLFAWPKRKVTKEKGHPAYALSGLPARKVRESGPGFSNGHPVRAKRSRHPCRLPLRGLSTPTRRCRGAPGRAAGHRGPHSSEGPKQHQQQQQQQQQPGNSGASLCSAALAFQFHHRVRARKARCSTRGPCAAVSRGRQARRGIGRMPIPFRQHMDVLSKSQAPAHGLAGQESGKRQAGCRFLLVTSLLDKQKRSNSPSEGGRKLFALKRSVHQQQQATMSRPGWVTQAQTPC